MAPVGDAATATLGVLTSRGAPVLVLSLPRHDTFHRVPSVSRRCSELVPAVLNSDEIGRGTMVAPNLMRCQMGEKWRKTAE